VSTSRCTVVRVTLEKRLIPHIQPSRPCTAVTGISGRSRMGGGEGLLSSRHSKTNFVYLHDTGMSFFVFRACILLVGVDVHMTRAFRGCQKYSQRRDNIGKSYLANPLFRLPQTRIWLLWYYIMLIIGRVRVKPLWWSKSPLYTILKVYSRWYNS